MRAGDTAIFAFLLAVMFVYLVLAAQYESLMLPLAVILIVPMCLIASIVGVVLRGQDNNILTQVGFIVLIALAAKNAILIVEFAKQLEDRGRDKFAAAVEAARLRLRPILMTSFAFIFGVTPLVWAVGAGAELRQTLGTTVFSGMIGVTFFGVIFTPVFYVITRWIAEHLQRRRARRRRIRRSRRVMAPTKFGFGQSVRRKEDDPLLRGRGRYIADAMPEGALHAVVVRSTHAHARVQTRCREGADDAGRAAHSHRRRHQGRRPDADAGRRGGRRHPRAAAIRCWRRTRCAMSATRSPSWWPIRWSRRRTPPKPSTIEWQALPHVVGAVAALEQGAVQVWPDRPGNLAFEVTLGDRAVDRQGDGGCGAHRVADADQPAPGHQLSRHPGRRSPNTTRPATG